MKRKCWCDCDPNFDPDKVLDIDYNKAEARVAAAMADGKELKLNGLTTGRLTRPDTEPQLLAHGYAKDLEDD